jgi:hypothetical protein
MGQLTRLLYGHLARRASSVAGRGESTDPSLNPSIAAVSTDACGIVVRALLVSIVCEWGVLPDAGLPGSLEAFLAHGASAILPSVWHRYCAVSARVREALGGAGSGSAVWHSVLWETPGTPHCGT